MRIVEFKMHEVLVFRKGLLPNCNVAFLRISGNGLLLDKINVVQN